MRAAPYVILALLMAGGPLRAQAVAERAGPVRPEPMQEAQADSVAVEGISPLGAFLRALALPTWGHSAIGSHRRGAFYLAAEGGTAWMILRTISRRSSAENVLEVREAAVRARVALEPPLDPEETPEEYEARVEAALDEDGLVADARARVEAREGQFEDWVAMGIFLTFLSGADAFVTAHLRDFPDPVEVVVAPTPGGGGVEVAAKLYLGNVFR
jgi:hypothetical protein